MKFLAVLVSIVGASRQKLVDVLFAMTPNKSAHMWLTKQTEYTLIGIDQNTLDLPDKSDRDRAMDAFAGMILEIIACDSCSERYVHRTAVLLEQIRFERDQLDHWARYEAWMINIGLRLLDEVNLDIFAKARGIIPSSPDRQDAIQSLVRGLHAFGISVHERRGLLGECTNGAHVIHKILRETSTDELVEYARALNVAKDYTDKISMESGIDVKLTFAPNALVSYFCSENRVAKISDIVSFSESAAARDLAIEWGKLIRDVQLALDQDKMNFIALPSLARSLPTILLKAEMFGDPYATQLLFHTRSVFERIALIGDKVFAKDQTLGGDLAGSIHSAFTGNRDGDVEEILLASMESVVDRIDQVDQYQQTAAPVIGESGPAVRIINALNIYAKRTVDPVDLEALFLVESILPEMEESQQRWLENTLQQKLISGESFNGVVLGCLIAKITGIRFLSLLGGVDRETVMKCSLLIHGPFLFNDRFNQIVISSVPVARYQTLTRGYKEFQKRSSEEAFHAAGFVVSLLYETLEEPLVNLGAEMGALRSLRFNGLSKRFSLDIAHRADPSYLLSDLTSEYEAFYRSNAMEVHNIIRGSSMCEPMLTVPPILMRLVVLLHIRSPEQHSFLLNQVIRAIHHYIEILNQLPILAARKFKLDNFLDMVQQEGLNIRIMMQRALESGVTDHVKSHIAGAASRLETFRNGIITDLQGNLQGENLPATFWVDAKLLILAVPELIRITILMQTICKLSPGEVVLQHISQALGDIIDFLAAIPALSRSEPYFPDRLAFWYMDVQRQRSMILFAVHAGHVDNHVKGEIAAATAMLRQIRNTVM